MWVNQVRTAQSINTFLKET